MRLLQEHGLTVALAESCTGGLVSHLITNVAGGSDYLLWCIPKRLGEKGTDYDFYDNGTGFQADFQNAETITDLENENYWTEDYYAYRSTNPGLGAITIETK